MVTPVSLIRLETSGFSSVQSHTKAIFFTSVLGILLEPAYMMALIEDKMMQKHGLRWLQ